MEGKSYWNRELLPVLLNNEKIFFHEILKLISERYIQNISLLADFIDGFLLNRDDVLSVERYNKLADFTCSLKSLDFTNIVSLEQKIQQKKNYIPFVFELHVDKFFYEVVVTAHWNASYLKEKFLSQDESLLEFEQSFIFLNDQIADPLHTQSTEHKIVIANLELDLAIEKTKVEKLNEEISHLKAHIAELEQVTPIHPSLDPAHKNHAPELLLAVQAWEAKYLKNEYPHQEHTPAITNILKNKKVTQVNLVKRICAITNHKK